MTMEKFLDPEAWLANGHGPRYLALRRRIEAAMDEGVLAPGDPLPPEREIARLTGTSRVTVRKAIEDLARSGRVVQRRGSGSFVGVLQQQGRMEIDGEPNAAPRPGPAVARLATPGEELALRGIETRVEILDQGLFSPNPDEIEALGLAPDAEVVRIRRLRLADGKPIGIEITVLPSDVFPKKPKKAGTALYAAMEKAGQRIVRAVQRVGAASLAKKDAKLLGGAKGDAVLTIRRTGYNAGGRAVEVTEAVYLAGTYDLMTEARAAGSTR